MGEGYSQYTRSTYSLSTPLFVLSKKELSILGFWTHLVRALASISIYNGKSLNPNNLSRKRKEEAAYLAISWSYQSILPVDVAEVDLTVAAGWRHSCHKSWDRSRIEVKLKSSYNWNWRSCPNIMRPRYIYRYINTNKRRELPEERKSNPTRKTWISLLNMNSTNRGMGDS